jgi:hypothetical protein
MLLPLIIPCLLPYTKEDHQYISLLTFEPSPTMLSHYAPHYHSNKSYEFEHD